MSLDQLKKMWHPDSQKTVKLWSDLDPTWPKEELKLFGPGTNSGTFDYFTEAVCGKEKLSRTDYTPSEDDNTLVKGVQGNKYALGYFGLAYAEQNKDKLTLVDVQGKSGSYITPTPTTVLDRSYPLSRPLFIYVKNSSLKRPEVAEFVKFQLRRDDLASKVGYVPLSAFQLTKQQIALEKALKQ
jgi:phosphate transport system substrate-binding protein